MPSTLSTKRALDDSQGRNSSKRARQNDPNECEPLVPDTELLLDHGYDIDPVQPPSVDDARHMDPIECEPLVLEPELLLDPSYDIDPTQPPPNDGARRELRILGSWIFLADTCLSDIVAQLTGATASRLEGLLGPESPILHAIKSSLQWRWERIRDEKMTSSEDPMRTDCMVAFVPGSKLGDFSIVMKVGYAAGGRIIEYLRYGDSIPQLATSSE